MSDIIDPFKDVQVGDTAPAVHSESHACEEFFEGFFCTRAPHPAEWKHIATGMDGRVLGVWEGVTRK